MTTHHVAPALLAELESALTAQLRARSAEGESWRRGISLYRKIIRENIRGVLQSVFPLFCRRFNEADIHHLTDAVLHQHHASQPEFHQVATELLLFMRQQRQISPCDRALIEYEWLLYAVEIDDSEVPPPERMTLPLAHIDNIEVARNPTLKIIALPFWIKEGEPYYEDGERLHYYALYRQYNNALYQKTLSQDDVSLLSSINYPVMAAELLSLTDIPLRLWLETNNNDELLSLKYKG